MGDRCYVQMTVPRADLEFWEREDMVESKDLSRNGSAVNIDASNVNYAAWDLRRKAAADGKVFFGSHGQGDGYGPMLFAACGGELAEVPCGFEGDGPIGRIMPDGSLHPADRAAARLYFDVLKKAREALAAVPVSECHVCANCGKSMEAPAVPLEECRDLGRRLEVGDPVPSGECSCGAFCYLEGGDDAKR